ncbi:MAG TPA: hypothetical protein VKT77_09050 [Chthonomonadaceae bacterium]|nr:hypothetical protein [Chthonomonadaceae bacterium]
MSYIPDKSAERMTIPVRISKGRVTYFYGGPMPRLTEGAVGDLVLSAHAIEDDEWSHTLRQQIEVEILPADAPLLLAMRFDKIPRDLYKHLYEYDSATLRHRFPFDWQGENEGGLRREYMADAKHWINFGFVPILLEGPLSLLLRGAKPAELRPARCRIPALDDSAISVNHAYTLVSQQFEPDRASHTGNVFDRARFEMDGRWRRLAELRESREADYERQYLIGRKIRSKPASSAPAGKVEPSLF